MKLLENLVQAVRRFRMVRHVRMVARIRDCNSSPEVRAACTALLHALVHSEPR